MALVINGIELKVDDAAAKIVSDEIKALMTRVDAADAKATSAEAKLGELQTAAGASAVELASLKARCDAAEAKVSKVERASLESEVSPVLGAEFKCDGKSDSELKAAVVAKMLPGVRCDGADAAFVQGAYASAMALHAKAAESLKAAAAESGAGSRTDATDANDPSKAREEMIAARRAAALKK